MKNCKQHGCWPYLNQGWPRRNISKCKISTPSVAVTFGVWTLYVRMNAPSHSDTVVSSRRWALQHIMLQALKNCLIEKQQLCLSSCCSTTLRPTHAMSQPSGATCNATASRPKYAVKPICREWFSEVVSKQRWVRLFTVLPEAVLYSFATTRM